MAEPQPASGEPPIHVELPDGVTIRPARPRDAGSFLDLWRSVVAEGRSVRSERVRQRPSHYRRQFRRSWTDTGAEIVAVSGEQVVGHLSIRREDSPTTAHVATLGIAVAADHRRQGIGSALIAECLRWARGVGVHKVMLSVFPHNAQAIGLYRKFGFVEEGRLVAYSRRAGGYQDELLMSVWLD
ncbi:MAG: GNAT family N-acetyltransferase [Actinomycetota bacterium]